MRTVPKIWRHRGGGGFSLCAYRAAELAVAVAHILVNHHKFVYLEGHLLLQRGVASQSRDDNYT